jgi:hypothetical protein
MIFKYHQKIKYSILFIFFLGCLLLAIKGEAVSLTKVSDRVDNSHPGNIANHTITFKVGTTIQANGKIIITPATGFSIMPDFDYTDMDMAISDSLNGTYAERALGATKKSAIDGVSVVTGASGSITITLSDTYGIDSNKFVQLELGPIANYSTSSDSYITNPDNPGSYKINIRTFDRFNQLLERADTFVAITPAVDMGAHMPKVRGNGRPTGVLMQGTTMTMLSLNTNFDGFCRYSTASNTSFYLMTNDFSNTGGVYHSTIVTGLTSGSWFSYYVRCMDTLGVVDSDDYLIYFGVEPSGGAGGTGGGTGSGTGSGTGAGDNNQTSGGGHGSGGGGGGSGGGAGSGIGTGQGDDYPYPLTGKPEIALDGWAYASSDVNIFQDGKIIKIIKANAKAEFNYLVTDLAEGTYTFGVSAKDSEERRSIINNYTFWLRAGTRSSVSGIFLAPTIEISKKSVKAGESLSVFGQTIPSGLIEVWLYPQMQTKTPDSMVKKKRQEAEKSGKWKVAMPTDNLSSGTYRIKARAFLTESSYSDFGDIISCTISGSGSVTTPSTGSGTTSCQRSDLNKDSKINIVDFSILMYNWGKTGPSGDINQDKKVNLTDFSMMMYCWTG